MLKVCVCVLKVCVVNVSGSVILTRARCCGDRVYVRRVKLVTRCEVKESMRVGRMCIERVSQRGQTVCVRRVGVERECTYSQYLLLQEAPMKTYW